MKFILLIVSVLHLISSSLFAITMSIDEYKEFIPFIKKIEPKLLMSTKQTKKFYKEVQKFQSKLVDAESKLLNKSEEIEAELGYNDRNFNRLEELMVKQAKAKIGLQIDYLKFHDNLKRILNKNQVKALAKLLEKNHDKEKVETVSINKKEVHQKEEEKEKIVELETKQNIEINEIEKQVVMKKTPLAETSSKNVNTVLKTEAKNKE